MSEPIRLHKENALPVGEDYVALRKLGFGHIERLGSALWTDYNTHDPGITMLEAVCYAITDLTYRTGWDMKDLLAPAPQSTTGWEHIFYSARQILHCQPLTINDYRKLLIDIDGVRNAWIEPSKDYEVPVFVNYNAIHPDQHTCDCDGPETPCFGQLTLHSDKETQTEEAKKTQDDYLALLDKQLGKYAADIAAKTKAIGLLQGRIAGLPADSPNRLALEQELADLTNQLAAVTNLQTEKTAYRKTIADHKNDAYGTKVLEINGLYNVLIEYDEDAERILPEEDIRQKVADRLNRNRNLCEDFISINEVEYDDFAVQVAVDLNEQADADQVLAQIYYVLYQYFTPTVWHRTIDQMLERGWTVEEIFEGPALRHGFIDDNELAQTDLFRDLRLSDIINQVVDIPGVVAVSRFYLTNAQGEVVPGPYFGQWVEQLQQARKVARLVTADCQAVFCKQRELITYQTDSPTDRRPARVNKLFADLRGRERAYKLKKQAVDFPIPMGENMELADYFPVQYSLPACYGVKEYDQADAIGSLDQKAQTLQLRGYMLFFEQLLADYLVQLDHLRDLFSFDDSVERTYFTRVLTEITDLDLLLTVPPHQGAHPHANPSVQERFGQVLNELAEKPKQFAERRNRFLNHLMARFSEDMQEYEALTRLVDPKNAEHRLLRDKINFLQDYIRVSSGRGAGFDYARAEGWAVHADLEGKPRCIENISGTERRIKRLLGMPALPTRSLAPANMVVQAVVTKDKPGEKPKPPGPDKQVIQILKPTSQPTDRQDVWLTSVAVSNGCCTEELMHLLIRQAARRSHYKLHDDINYRSRKNQGEVGQFWYELLDTDGETAIATSPPYAKREDREAAIRAVMAWVGALNAQEGLHMVEHILLRPRLDEVLDEAGTNDVEVALPTICLNPCDLGIGLGEGETPTHRIKVSRLPADQCFDKMPWKLEVLERGATLDDEISMLFQAVFAEGNQPPNPLKFKRYDQLSDRVAALREFGSERVNYTIVSNGAEGNDVRYGFVLHTDDPRVVVGQSRYIYRRLKVGKVITNEAEQAIARLIRYFSFQLDWYCKANGCDHNEDPYSFRATVVLPCWTSRFSDKTYRNLVEKIIQTQSPAHVAMRVMWVGIEQMRRFETAYAGWLTEMATNEVPAYEKVNPLVTVLDTLQPCGHCQDDCTP